MSLFCLLPYDDAGAMSSCPRTLIVEDDPSSRRGLERLISAYGHDVRVAANVAEACVLLSTWPPGCILLDLMLPDGLGTEVIRQARAQGLVVRVAVTSGTSDPAILAEAAGMKPDAFFAKPIDFAGLKSWLTGSV